MDSLRQILAIAVVFGGLWLALWALKKKPGLRLPERKNAAGRGALQSRGRLMLGPQHSLHLVRIGERELALAVHPSGIVVLCDVAPCAVLCELAPSAPERVPEA